MSRLLFIALAFAAEIACNSLDVSRPIVLSPSESLSENEIVELVDAAESWNVYFATSLSVSEGRGGGENQVVEVGLSDFVCGYAAGLTEYLHGSRVTVCDAMPRASLFSIFRHELGHVLNVTEHARGTTCVMHESGLDARTFQKEDRRLFYEANAEFATTSQKCGVHVIEDSGAAGIVHRYFAPVIANKQPFVIWTEGNTVRVGRVASGDNYQIVHKTTVKWPSLWNSYTPAVGAGNEVLLFGYKDAGGKLQGQLMRVDVLSMEASKPVDIGQADNSLMLDAVWSGQGIVAVYQEKSGVKIYEMELKGSGIVKSLLVENKTATAGYIASREKITYCALADDKEVQFTAFNAAGGTWNGIYQWPKQLADVPVGNMIVGVNGLVIAVTAGSDTVMIASIKKENLVLQNTSKLRLPADCVHVDAVADSKIIASNGRLAMVLSCDVGVSKEVFLTLLDEVTLQQEVPWKMISAKDRTSSRSPTMAIVDDNLVIYWSDDGKWAYKVAIWNFGTKATLDCPAEP